MEVDPYPDRWKSGHLRDVRLVHRELYTLLNIFAGSAELSKRAVLNPESQICRDSIERFEFFEISRILVTVAAVLRNDGDANPILAEEQLAADDPVRVVGELVKDVDGSKPAIGLGVRESFNKIIHAERLHLDKDSSEELAPLNPKLHLYGTYLGKRWKAVLDVYRWAEAAYALS